MPSRSGWPPPRSAAWRPTPCFQVAQVLWERMRHAESLLDVRHHLEVLSADHASVPQQRNLSRRDFLERYYAANRPVVLLGYADAWRARALWSLDHLRTILREVEVEVLAGRESDPKFESNSDPHRQTMPFGEFLDWVATTDVSNDRYLSARNHFLAGQPSAARPRQVTSESESQDQPFPIPPPFPVEGTLLSSGAE